MRLKKKKKKETVQVSLVGRINKRIQAKCHTFGVCNGDGVQALSNALQPRQGQRLELGWFPQCC